MPPPRMALGSAHPAAPHLSLERSWSLSREHTHRAPRRSSPCIHHRSAGRSGSHRTSLEEGEQQLSPPSPLPPPPGPEQSWDPWSGGTRATGKGWGEKQPEARVPPGAARPHGHLQERKLEWTPNSVGGQALRVDSTGRVESAGEERAWFGGQAGLGCSPAPRLLSCVTWGLGRGCGWEPLWASAFSPAK